MVHVYTSTVIEAPSDLVWTEIRDFNALPRWVPAVKESRIELNQPSDKVGCIRNFTLRDGGRLREQLLALSDYDMSCTYSILESPMGVTNYVATLKLIPITDGNRTFIEWTADFDCPPARTAELVETIGRGVFQAAFDTLKSRLGGRGSGGSAWSR
ncbi:MAG: SRPBCC family protein [Sphingomonadales bacterium]|nr:SRPBCC family protein [Sphingomonadales bacterium]